GRAVVRGRVVAARPRGADGGGPPCPRQRSDRRRARRLDRPARRRAYLLEPDRAAAVLGAARAAHRVRGLPRAHAAVYRDRDGGAGRALGAAPASDAQTALAFHYYRAMSDAPRVVRAPRGTALSCRGWPQEAALRMLMNNLDPEVAERPQDLVV